MAKSVLFKLFFVEKRMQNRHLAPIFTHLIHTRTPILIHYATKKYLTMMRLRDGTLPGFKKERERVYSGCKGITFL